ncbi:hypothetical protein, partial [Burkholderia multivorans]
MLTATRGAARRRALGARTVAQRATRQPATAFGTAYARASWSPRHDFDCVQNSESPEPIQDTVPCRSVGKLHPHMRANAGREEYRRTCAAPHGRARRKARGKAAADGACGARRDLGAQRAGRRRCA